MKGVVFNLNAETSLTATSWSCGSRVNLVSVLVDSKNLLLKRIESSIFWGVGKEGGLGGDVLPVPSFSLGGCQVGYQLVNYRRADARC